MPRCPGAATAATAAATAAAEARRMCGAESLDLSINSERSAANRGESLSPPKGGGHQTPTKEGGGEPSSKVDSLNASATMHPEGQPEGRGRRALPKANEGTGKREAQTARAERGTA